MRTLLSSYSSGFQRLWPSVASSAKGAAFLSTAVTALQSFVVLFSIRRQSFEVEMVNRISIYGVLSGWLATALLTLFRQSPFWRKESTALGLYVFSVVLCELLAFSIYGLPMGLDTLLMAGGFLLPLLYTISFYKAAVNSQFRWSVDRRFSLGLLTVAFLLLGRWLAGDSPGLFFLTTGLSAVVGVALWFIDGKPAVAVFAGTGLASSRILPRAFLNSILPVFDRTLLDQLVLVKFGLIDRTWFFYFLTRLISFGGNVFLAYLSVRVLHGTDRRKILALTVALPLVALGLCLGFQLQTNLQAAMLAGQVCAWMLSSILLGQVSENDSKYEWILGIWGVDLIARAIWLNSEVTGAFYTVAIQILSVVTTLASGYVLMRRPTRAMAT